MGRRHSKESSAGETAGPQRTILGRDQRSDGIFNKIFSHTKPEYSSEPAFDYEKVELVNQVSLFSDSKPEAQ